MVALWIQEQSQGRTRLAIVGLPRRLGDRFQLVVAATQYRGPERPNILRLDYPPMRIDAWRRRLQHSRGLRCRLEAATGQIA